VGSRQVRPTLRQAGRPYPTRGGQPAPANLEAESAEEEDGPCLNSGCVWVRCLKQVRHAFAPSRLKEDWTQLHPATPDECKFDGLQILADVVLTAAYSSSGSVWPTCVARLDACWPSPWRTRR
jgi:hypothetical protein